MYTYPWYHWIIFFYIYCFFGWIFESAYVSLRSRHFVNRGFLRLPMLPLYGSGAVILLWASLPVQDNIFLVWLIGVAAATILEYVTGYGMERLFNMRYWDYSGQRFQLHGYICVSSSVAWGFLTVLLTRFLHHPIAELVMDMNPVIEFSLIGIISVMFLTDVVKSFMEALDLGRTLEALTKIKAELEEAQVQLALMKAETNQRITGLKEETSQRMAGIKMETVQIMANIKLETSQLVSDIKEETALSDRLKILTERRHILSKHMSFYRKSILKGNPTSSSSRFAEALRELKDSVDNIRNNLKK